MFTESLLYWASRPVVGTYTGAMLKMDVQKHRELPEGAKIIAANHPSTTDPFFVAAILGQQSFILIKNVLFQVPVFGSYLRRSGHIPVKVGDGQAAIDAALDHLSRGHTVMIFPEGDLSPQEGGFHKARTGVARLALASGAPVIPVGVHLSRERLHVYRSVVKGQEEVSRWYLRGPYHVTVGQPLQFSGAIDDHDRVRLVARIVMHHIIELARESENRFKQTPDSLVSLPNTL